MVAFCCLKAYALQGRGEVTAEELVVPRLARTALGLTLGPLFPDITAQLQVTDDCSADSSHQFAARAQRKAMAGKLVVPRLRAHRTGLFWAFAWAFAWASAPSSCM